MITFLCGKEITLAEIEIIEGFEILSAFKRPHVFNSLHFTSCISARTGVHSY